MKKIVTMIVVLALIICTIPLQTCAIEEDEITVYAAICDEEGNVLQNLEVTKIESNDSGNARNNDVYREVTYSTKTTTTSDTSNPQDGITATLTIAWNDFFGTNNQLVSVSGSWAIGDETISDRTVCYFAEDFAGNELQYLEKHPTSNSFVYEPTNFTGYRFWLYSEALIDSTGKYITFIIST